MRWCLPYLLALLFCTPGIAVSQQVAPGAGQDLRGFWSRDDARAWDKPVSPNSSQTITYHDYPRTLDQIRADEQAEMAKKAEEATMRILPAVQNPLENQEVEDAAVQSSPEAPVASTPLNRQQILEKYGAPEEAQVIRAQKDSPPAMQGLFEALNSNDKELAFRYAVALAKRQVEMQKVVSKATDYQMLAMEAIGIRQPPTLPDDGEPLDPVRAEVQAYYEQARQQELRNGEKIGLHLGAIQQQVAAESSGPTEAQSQKGIQSVIPVDPKGNVKVLIFLDEKSPDSLQVAEGLKSLRDRYKNDPQFTLLGLTKRTYSVYGLKKYGAEISFPFPLVSGEALAIDLRIKSYPTTVFVAATTKETYRVSGVPETEEIARIVEVMRGGRSQRSEGGGLQ